VARWVAPALPDAAAAPGGAADSSSAPAEFETPADSTVTPPPAPAPEAEARIGAVTVAGNKLTDADRVVRSFEVPAGARYSSEMVRRGIVKLVALGLFDDVWVEKRAHDAVVDLVIHVKERPRIGKIEFTGQRHKDLAELEKRETIKVGEIYSPSAVQTQIDSLMRWYHDEGYAKAQIKAELDTTGVARTSTASLRFILDEGDKVRITAIHFAGAHAFAEGTLKKQLKTKGKGVFGGGEVKDENLEEDVQKIEAFYKSHGYRDARVTGHDLTPGRKPHDLTLTWTVEEGRPYRMGNIAWEGNKVVPLAELKKLWTPRYLERYDASKIERTQGGAYAAYAERGYLSVGIDARETVRDSNVVDITFGIAEGPPSSIRYVLVQGNKNTREKVIRREIEIHEGDRFRRSSLVRTHDDLMRLGIFEEVQPDIQPADSNDVDLILKVKEKQVGTASAGAGYTGTTGLTGFLEIGHNNVLGNAQTLSLHLERGARLSNYFVSFTEPWFKDTPTLLGFSVYNSSTDRDIYTEQHTGGSVKIGRPLAWPRYSRGSLTYRLEDVKIYALNHAALAAQAGQDSAVLAGFLRNEGRPVRTSSLTLDFNRNSTDNPFYPTRGTRLLWTSELAGGPFGGQTNFHLSRIEGRWYTKTPLFRPMTTMFKVRTGLLGKYTGQNLDVPVYERFRLGGGSTLDPLRGYEDYQIVPDKFDYIAPHQVILSHTDSLGGTVSDTSTVYSRVRYPGGRFFTVYTVEEQFPIVHPLHGVLFFDAGNTWDQFNEIRPFDLKMGAGIGFRMEIPLLGNVGFDYAYGFNRDDGPRFKAHFLLGNINF